MAERIDNRTDSSKYPGMTQSIAGVDAEGKPRASVYLGLLPDEKPKQFGLLGYTIDRRRPIALNLNDPQCLTVVGQPGAGKSYTLGVISEMTVAACRSINYLPQQLCTVFFHYSDSEFYPPEMLAQVLPNDHPQQVKELQEQWEAQPVGCTDLICLAPPAMLERRRQEFPHIRYEPLALDAQNEIQASHWRILMGAVGDRSLPVIVIKNCIRDLAMRDQLSLETLRDAIRESQLPEIDKKIALIRLDTAAKFLGSAGISQHVKPGRTIVVDLRDEYLEKSEVFGLLMTCLQIFASADYQGKPINKLVIFDEAHQYMSDPDLIECMVGLIRVMRHKRTMLCFASQDPISLPQRVLELSTQIIMHKMVSPLWLKHIQSVNPAIESIKPIDVMMLESGQAFVWSQKASEAYFMERAVKVKIRPRFSKHGGFTKSAVQ